MRPVISAIGHVALCVQDIDACVQSATEIMGLAVRSQTADAVNLTHGAPHHSLQYIQSDHNALDHIGLEAPDVDALGEVRRRVEVAGFTVIQDGPLDDTLEHGFACEGPEGIVFEIYCGMSQAPIAPVAGGVRPTRFGHVNYTAGDTSAAHDFLSEVLDFRVSDAVVNGYFMRCNVDHHGIAVLPGPGHFHHHAWEVSEVSDLVRLCDRVHEAGQHILWGPVRHPCGNNVAAYFLGADGTVVEYYCDMERIYDEQSFEVPIRDIIKDSWFSVWAQTLPEAFADIGVPLSPRVGTTS